LPTSGYLVHNITQPASYCSIQDALDAANPYDVIEVSTGTYNEDLVFNVLGVELRPAGTDVVIIKGVDTEPVANWPLANPNMDVLADRVSIHGFTIQSPAYVAGYYSSGIIVGAQQVSIYENDFEVWSGDDAGGDEIGQAIQTYYKGAMPGVDVSELNIHHNTFTNLNPGTQWGYEGIYINLDEGSGNVNIRYNTFTGELVRAITVERSNAYIDENTIITDLPPYASPGALEGISIRYAGPGGPFPQSHIFISDNIIKGSAAGLGFLRGIRLGISGQALSTFEIEENTIEGNTIGVLVRSSADGVELSDKNKFINNLTAVENEDINNTLDATENFWGMAYPDFNTILVGDISFCQYYTDELFTTLYCPPVHNITQDIWYYTIQTGADDAVSGDKVEKLKLQQGPTTRKFQ